MLLPDGFGGLILQPQANLLQDPQVGVIEMLGVEGEDAQLEFSSSNVLSRTGLRGSARMRLGLTRARLA